MCVIDGQFWIIETKDGLKLWTKTCNCFIMDCTIEHGSFLRVGWSYQQEKVIPRTLKSKKIKPIQPLDAGLTPATMESDMFIKELHAEEQVQQTLVELPPEVNMLKQLQELTGGNLVVAAAILLGFMFMKMQKQKSQETGCGHSQEKCDKAHVELSDALKKIELDIKDMKQVQLNFIDEDKIQKIEKDVKELQEKIK